MVNSIFTIYIYKHYYWYYNHSYYIIPLLIYLITYPISSATDISARLASTGPKTAAFVEALRKVLLDDDATVRAEAAAAAGSAGVEEELLERAETYRDGMRRFWS